MIRGASLSSGERQPLLQLGRYLYSSRRGAVVLDVIVTPHPRRPHRRAWINSNRDTPPRPSPDATTGASHSNSEHPGTTSWVNRYLPRSYQPYAHLARMDKPIGTFLLLWPCAWSTALAAPPGMLPDPSLLLLFTTGAFAMRGAGCTINDLWDQDIDAQVRRTSTRPLARGELSQSQAMRFLVLQLTTGLAVLLSLPHTWFCFQWGAASLPLVFIYPSMKRFFPYPQLFLGLTFNWGAWMGWAAVHGSMDYNVITPLYGAGVTWTLVYDTIYAHQDKEDDHKLGLQSTAISFGSNPIQQRRILHGLAFSTWMQLLWAGYQAELAMLPYTMGTILPYSHLAWQIQTADFSSPENLSCRFRSNNTTGALVFASIVMGKLWSG